MAGLVPNELYRRILPSSYSVDHVVLASNVDDNSAGALDRRSPCANLKEDQPRTQAAIEPNITPITRSAMAAMSNLMPRP
jgi:hypothetical protein